MLRFSCLLLSTWLAATPLGAQSSTPVGVWLHDNKRIEIAIAPCGETLCGTLVWLKRPNDAQGLPLVDQKNPNSALRTRPLLGLTVVDGLRRTGENTWENGNIYDPDDGSSYTVSMSMLDDGSLRMRAYILTPMLGKTFVWTRMRAIGYASKQGS